MKPGRVVRMAARALPELAAISANESISCRAHLRQQFEQSGYGKREAEERAEEWDKPHHRALTEELARWRAMGLPLPIVHLADRGMVLTPQHDNYAAGGGGLTADHARWDTLVRDANDHGLRLLGAAYLTACGCAPVLVVDGPGDGGADVAGVKCTLLGPEVVILQSKSAGAATVGLPVVKDDVFKYRREFWASQLSRLVLAKLFDAPGPQAGVTDTYVFVTGARLTDPVVPFALAQRVVLRGRSHVAHQLARTYDFGDIVQIMADNPKLRRDLELDWSRKLAPLLHEPGVVPPTP